MKYLFIDFEFNQTKEYYLNLVCVSFQSIQDGVCHLNEQYWLLDQMERLAAIEVLSTLIFDHTIVSYALGAEIRSLVSLLPGLDPQELTGIDLQQNYKMLINHNPLLSYGRHLVDGKQVVIHKPKPKWSRRDGEPSGKAQTSLVSCTYKLIGVDRDLEHKDRMRDIIIHGGPESIENNREEIIKYCASDVEFLPRILDRQIEEMRKTNIPLSKTMNTFLNLGKYAIHSSMIEMVGYPVNLTELKKFSGNILSILNSAAELVNEKHPEIKAFQYNKKTNSYTQKKAPIKKWVEENHDINSWRRTDNNDVSLSLDAFKDYYSSSDESFGGSIVSYLKTKQSLNGFSPNKSEKGSFFDAVGSDERCRPYYNIFGSQTSRTQPPATHFIPLKAKWMRYFIQPKPGRAIINIDYASEEFFIAALLSNDKRMIDAYLSGDIYLAFAKDINMVPRNATKESHPKQRDICKTLILGISYKMSAKGLSSRLIKIDPSMTEEKTESIIKDFYDTYHSYYEWGWSIQEDYKDDNKLSLRDGWTLFGDNDNYRSVLNFPVQGAGADIMRRAVIKAHNYNLDVIYTLHDAIAVEYDSDKLDTIRILGQCMVDAFKEYFPERKEADQIRLDGMAWGYDYKISPIYKPFFKLDFSERYIDEKGKRDLERYIKFFN